MREIIFLIVLSSLVFASLDQSYQQVVKRSGDSLITKSSDLTVFQNSIGNLTKIEELCNSNKNCEFRNKTIYITEEFQPGNYYTYKEEYGFPFVEQVITIRKIPTDIFGESLDRVIIEAEAIDSVPGSIEAIDLLESETNLESSIFLKRFDIKIIYKITMPSQIYDAYSGNISANITDKTAEFNLVDILGQSSNITVKSREINMSLIIIISAIIVFSAMALSVKNSFKKTRSNK